MNSLASTYESSNAQLFSSLDSLEGVPDWFEPRVRVETRKPWQQRLHAGLESLGEALPGVGLAAGIALLGMIIARLLGSSLFPQFKESPISPILIAVMLGLLIRNLVGVPVVYEQGLRLCIKTILRVGIVLLGLRLSLAAVASVGLVGLPIIIGCIATALITITWLNRVLGLPRRLGTLIAAGTSICGVSAIVATAPIIDAEDDEVSYAVACVTIFGLTALFTYPFLAFWIFNGEPQLAGLFMGTSIHDTSQVAGAGLMYAQQYNAPAALDTAVVVKLVRNLCMAGVIPLFAIMHRRRSFEGNGSAMAAAPKWHQYVPLFVLGFVLMVVIRSAVDWSQARNGWPNVEAWNNVLSTAGTIAIWCLAIAMASVGLHTGLSRLRELGLRPFTIGFAAALLVGGVSVVLVKLLGPMIP